MKFSIDECLHTSLLAFAPAAGYICDRVNFLGLGGRQDWRLMDTVRAEEYTSVTNNGSGFMALYRAEEVHAGLVIIVPCVTPACQRDLFAAALSHIGIRDLTNAVLDVDLSAATATCREYPYPHSS